MEEGLAGGLFADTERGASKRNRESISNCLLVYIPINVLVFIGIVEMQPNKSYDSISDFPR